MMMPRACARGREGSTLIAATMLTIPIVVFSAATLSLSTTTMQGSVGSMHGDRALYLAEAGVDRFLAVLGSGGSPPDTLTGTLGGGTWRVVHTAGTRDGQDNDNDSYVDEADESAFSVLESTGRAHRSGRTIQVVVRRVGGGSFTAPGALYIDDVLPDTTFSGNAFCILGTDQRFDGGRGPGPDVYGIGTISAATLISTRLRSNQRSRIMGLGGSIPNIRQVSAVDYSPLEQLARTSPDVRLDDPGLYRGDLGDAWEGDYKVTFCDGDLRLNGNRTGAGILFVDGDLRMEGNYEYVGIVIVRGELRMEGNATIWGGTLIADAIGGGRNARLNMRGSSNILYDSQAVQTASSMLPPSGIRIVLWRETGTT